MEKLNLTWALSISRLIDLTARDRKRVVRPVSPRIVITMVLLPSKTRKPRRDRHG